VYDCWVETSDSGLKPRLLPVAVWTGSRAVFYGGWYPGFEWRSVPGGAMYDPLTDSWSGPTDPNLDYISNGNPQSQRAVWTGTRMIVFRYGEAASFDPAVNQWSKLPKSPYGTTGYAAGLVWSAGVVVVWGAAESQYCGAVYHVDTDSWTTLEPPDPSLCGYGLVLAIGDRLVVLGGQHAAPGAGAIFSPAKGTWTKMSGQGAPSPRDRPIGAWTGTEVIVWGGYPEHGTYSDGALYDPATDKWRPMASNTSLAGVSVSAWCDGRLFVYADSAAGGGLYDPERDEWTPISVVGIPDLSRSAVVGTGSEVVFWGGNWDSSRGWVYRPPPKKK
jgi:hypothetical protein